jgi:hypothetical protein
MGFYFYTTDMKKTLIVLLLITGCGAKEGVCPDAVCADYLSQGEAQAAYDSDPDCYGELDHDSDLIACEDNFAGGGGTTNCPTTSNCGCSNKNKDVCESSCCKWVVGDGCKCR